MSIFRKASELNNIPSSINNAFFDKKISNDLPDEFDGLLKEASSNKSIYENRLKEFKKLQNNSYEFTKPEPTKYSEVEGGIRRSSYGQRFSDETSDMFVSDKIRSTIFDNNKYSSNDTNFSIWEPEFDELQEAFSASQKVNDKIFDRVSASERQAAKKQSWEQSTMSNIRQTKVLPYRGLGITRIGNEQPLNHGNFGSVNDYYTEAHDTLVEMTRQANRERKASISRQGFDPEEAGQENKEAINVRTMKALNNASFLSKFAEEINLDGL